MERLFLGDLAKLTYFDVINHIVDSYSDYGNSEQQSKIRHLLDEYDVLIAYESVGDYGCDSSSFFLLQHLKNKTYHEVHGGHCSCYGFEGQFEIEKVSPIEYLQSDKFYFSTGGYDDDSSQNMLLVRDYLNKL